MKVLIAESDRKLARLLQRVLSERGYTTDRCASGADALAQAVSGFYCLIILDGRLVDVDGLAVCRQLRESGESLPVLMLTMRGEITERVQALRSGADDCLAKPFEIEELLARVAALLRRAEGYCTWRFGPLEIDRAGHRIRLGGTPLSLTARELGMLLHLAYRAGQIVTRAELWTQVWSTQFDPESNVIEVHITRLRKKLQPHASIIETVRGRGYRIRMTS